MQNFNPASFAAFAAALASAMGKASRDGLEKGCEILEAEAKHVLGTDGYNWAPLSPATKKTMPGMLLETGELRDSIEHTIISDSEAAVGSDHDKAVWHELGTEKMPARSFMMGAAVAKEQEIRAAIADHFMKAFKP